MFMSLLTAELIFEVDSVSMHGTTIVSKCPAYVGMHATGIEWSM